MVVLHVSFPPVGVLRGKNDISTKIKRHNLCAGKTFYGLKKYLKSNLFSKKTKLVTHKTLVRPILTYASETRKLSRADERSLGLFERKVLKCIFGAVHSKYTWWRRYNNELFKLFNEPGITKYIKINRLNWARHIVTCCLKAGIAVPDWKLIS
ncbi:hypothetical protein B7P43_G14576 [Cryptotermes secundus]|uniref:Uncharacterized protein n=1 Tax=Cryptotermes secundus TaxID=105785 RepID=A0A2J7PE13_9NEOP|nr:hypothetical protein B7P43_G14576 [Cryptotermes secundus]